MACDHDAGRLHENMERIRILSEVADIDNFTQHRSEHDKRAMLRIDH